jgi:hypothetical protein
MPTPASLKLERLNGSTIVIFSDIMERHILIDFKELVIKLVIFQE